MRMLLNEAALEPIAETKLKATCSLPPLYHHMQGIYYIGLTVFFIESYASQGGDAVPMRDGAPPT